MKTLLETLKRKWSEYLLEVFVITFGILLAFGLNNWNQRIKANKKEKGLLVQLRKNLQDNLVQLNDDHGDYVKKINSIGIVVEHLKNEYPNNDTLAQHFYGPFTPGATILTSSAYQTLKSIGLDAIQNEELREKCIDLYEIAYPQLQNTVGQTLNNWEVEMIVPYYSNNFSFDHALGLVPNDYNRLLNDQKFVNILTARDDFFRYVLTVLESNIARTQAIIDMLDQYLDQAQ